MMLKNLRVFGLLFLLIAIFITFKLPTLQVPYFWDELGVYVPGALKMKDAGTIGILPRDLEPEFSRGHPLLFYFITSSFFKIFGDSIAVGHSLAILLGVATLIAIFFFAQKIFDEKTAIIATVFTAVQPIFFAMSGVLFPEMLLSILSVLGMWGILEKRLWLYVLAGSLAVLDKESGLVIPATALVFWTIDLLRTKKLFSREAVKILLIACVPVVVFALFLVVQKQQNGWYFFPYHVELMQVSLHSIWGTSKTFFIELFFQQGRFLLTIIYALATIYKLFFKMSFSKTEKQLAFLFLIFYVFATLFAAPNFYLSRYMLFVYPVYIVLVAPSVIQLSAYVSAFLNKKIQSVIELILVAVVSIVAITQMDTKKFHDTYNMSYLHTVHAVQKAVIYMETQHLQNQKMTIVFPIFQAIQDKRNGYLSGEAFPNFSTEWNTDAEYVAFFTLHDEKIPDIFKSYTLLQQFNEEHSHVHILKKP